MLLPFQALLALSLCGPVLASNPDGWPSHQGHTSNNNNKNPLIVSTDSGTHYRGLINGSAPHVREFLGIPFAKPPTDTLRWLPPQKLDNNGSSQLIDATRYPPSCPQYVSDVPTVWNDANTNYIISGLISEDCLALSIWTPMEAEKLPVVMFITGGGFQTGGVEINYQLPYNWVEKTQGHVVVTIK